MADNELVNAGEMQIVPSNEWIAERDSILARASQVQTVDDEESFRVAGAIDKDAKKVIKDLSKVRMTFTRKLDALKKNIMAQEKDLAKPLQEESDRLNKQLVLFFQKQEQKRREEERRIAEEQRKAAEAEAAKATACPFSMNPTSEPEPAIHPVVVPHTEVPKSATNFGVKRITFKVIDPTLVPRQFCTPDSSLIRAYVDMQKRATGGDINLIAPIPGVQIYEDYQVRTK